MIHLKCDTCKKEYNFKDTLRARVLIDGPHEAMPIGKNCVGMLRVVGEVPSMQASIDFRGLASGPKNSNSPTTIVE